MGIYAKETSVSPEKSRMEIEQTLKRYKASQFAYATSDQKATIMFVMNDRQIRFDVPFMPIEYFSKDKRGFIRWQMSAKINAREQDIRQRWRALALSIKGRLEAIESGIETFEIAFLAHIVLPNGQTYGQFAVPQIEKVYEHKQMPPLLIGSPQ